MAALKIVKIGNPVLRSPCKAVSAAMLRTPKFQRFLKDMVKTMHAASGVGLAANQTGVNRQAIVLECKANKRYPWAGNFPLAVYLNPRIVHYSKALIRDWEGCLSIPGYRGLVPRSKKVTLSALTPDGKPVTQTFEGFQARVIQHEVDHIQGKFYIDRMPDLSSWCHLDEF